MEARVAPRLMFLRVSRPADSRPAHGTRELLGRSEPTSADRLVTLRSADEVPDPEARRHQDEDGEVGDPVRPPLLAGNTSAGPGGDSEEEDGEHADGDQELPVHL